jgi:hypothetical protein
MTSTWTDRRVFLRLCSAFAAFLTQSTTRLAHSSPQSSAPQTPRSVKHRKNFVAIQVKPIAWVDEGIDAALDNMQQKGAVNTVWAYTCDYGEAHMTRDGNPPLPDHGVPGSPEFVGGAFYDYDPKYFRDTILKDFRSPDYGKFDVIAEVAPKVKARGMDFFAFDYNNAMPIMSRSIPNFSKVAEIDIDGRCTTSPCFNHPDYQALLEGKIESLLGGYPNQVDGIAWGCERMGPLQNMIGGMFATPGISCFCEHCRAKARARDISVERAQQGYMQLNALFHAAAGDQHLVDGYFVTFWRLLLEYPEILSWEKLWTDSYHEVRSKLYGVGIAIAPGKPFGFHMSNNLCLSPFYRAEEDYARVKKYSDYLKIATYKQAGGPRMATYLDLLSATIFHDARPQDFLPFYYKIMNYEEAPYDQLPTSGLSADSVARETKRAIADVGGEVKIYTSIDIDIGTKRTEKRTTPEDVRESVRAALGAGADGVVLSRAYEEMWLANLSAAGATLREIWGASFGK